MHGTPYLFNNIRNYSKHCKGDTIIHLSWQHLLNEQSETTNVSGHVKN